MMYITLIVFACAIAVSSGQQCIWYGECHTSSMGRKQYCKYDGPPKPLNQSSEAWKTFVDLCPQLVEKAKEFGLCCDSAMIETVSRSTSTAKALLGVCPSCYHNMRNLWCQLGCSPQQGQFAKVLKTAYNDEIGASYVTKVKYFVKKDYSNKLFDSCKGVTMEEGSSVIPTMCGGKQVDDCTTKDWLKILGDNRFSPFITEFSIVNNSAVAPTGTIPFDDHVVPCNEGVDPSGQGCPCDQCPASCSENQ